MQREGPEKHTLNTHYWRVVRFTASIVGCYTRRSTRHCTLHRAGSDSIHTNNILQCSIQWDRAGPKTEISQLTFMRGVYWVTLGPWNVCTQWPAGIVISACSTLSPGNNKQFVVVAIIISSFSESRKEYHAVAQVWQLSLPVMTLTSSACQHMAEGAPQLKGQWTIYWTISRPPMCWSTLVCLNSSAHRVLTLRKECSMPSEDSIS
jgi:hypothetical protein